MERETERGGRQRGIRGRIEGRGKAQEAANRRNCLTQSAGGPLGRRGEQLLFKVS